MDAADIKRMRWLLLIVFLFIYLITAILTLLAIFFQIGNLSQQYEGILISAFLVETAGAIAALFYALFGLRRQDETADGVIKTEGIVGEITPAEVEVSESEIISPEPQRLGSPDGGYSIIKPPDDWDIRELSFAEWASEGLQITDPTISNTVVGTLPRVREILTLESSRITSIVPDPRKTLVDGRKIPTALETKAPIRLDILPIEHAQPPFFIERPFEHNFMSFLSGLLTPSVLTFNGFDKGVIPNTQLRYLTANLSQEIVNAVVNGKEEESIINNMFVIGIEGGLRDYILLMKYPSLPFIEDPELEIDLNILQSIVSSFAPLKVVDLENKREVIRQELEEQFDEFVEESGEELFSNEIGVAFLRLSSWDINDLEKQLEAIKLLKPFELLAQEINLQNEDFDSLWDSLHEAEAGNAISLIEHVAEIKSIVLEKDEVDQTDLRSLSPPEKETQDNSNDAEDVILD